MPEENPLEQAAKAGLMAPLWQLVQMGASLPQQLIADSGTALAKQVQEFPDIVKRNMEYFQEQLRDMPENLKQITSELTKSNQELFKDGFPIKTLFPPLDTKTTNTQTENKKNTGLI